MYDNLFYMSTGDDGSAHDARTVLLPGSPKMRATTTCCEASCLDPTMRPPQQTTRRALPPQVVAAGLFFEAVWTRFRPGTAPELRWRRDLNPRSVLADSRFQARRTRGFACSAGVA